VCLCDCVCVVCGYCGLCLCDCVLGGGRLCVCVTVCVLVCVGVCYVFVRFCVCVCWCGSETTVRSDETSVVATGIFVSSMQYANIC
jgi:hypothetical protein